MSASEERATIAQQKLRDLVDAQQKSMQKIDDVSEQKAMIERAFKAIEIELVSTKTELSVKNHLLDMLTGKMMPEGNTVVTENMVTKP